MAEYAELAGTASVESRWRRFLGWILLFTHVGIVAELLLLEHFETVWQAIPVVLLGIGTIVFAVAMFRPRRFVLQAVRLLMLLYVISGALGVWLHYDSNVEFEKEMKPALTGWQLFVDAIAGAVPTLSPGTMAQIGLLGLLYTFAHPALQRRRPAGDR